MIYIDLDRYVFCRLVSIFRVVLVLGWLCGCMDRWENGPGSRKTPEWPLRTEVFIKNYFGDGKISERPFVAGEI